MWAPSIRMVRLDRPLNCTVYARLHAQYQIDIFASSLPDPEAHERALALAAMCVGATVIARAVDDATLGDEIRSAARGHLLNAFGAR